MDKEKSEKKEDESASDTTNRANGKKAEGSATVDTQGASQAAKPLAGSPDTTGAATKVAHQDAEAALKADHRKVEQLFQQYQAAKESKKAELAKQICSELIVHAKLEEEIFYPACREKDVEDDDLDEAQVEHDGAKIMIAELIAGSPKDAYYDAKVTVLSEYIKHHVGEEERPGDGIFAKAKKAGVDTKALGSRLQARKAELMEQVDDLLATPPQPVSLARRTFNNNNQENSTMARNDRDRDDEGRFTSEDENDSRRGSSSSRGGYSTRSNRDDEDRGNGRRSASSDRDRDRDRDDRGRFASDDNGGRGSSREGYSSRSGRDEDDGREGRRSSGSDRDRDENGRFMSDDDRNNNGRSSRGRDDHDDDRGGRGQSSSRSSRDDDDDRGGRSSGRSSSSRSSRDGDDDRNGRSSGGRGEGRGGWFGDSEGHSQAAERGWESRESSNRDFSSRRGSRDDDDDRSDRNSARGNSSSRSSRDDDDDRGSRSRSGRGDEGHGGWFGDREGHSEAAQRGWEGRSSGSSRSSRDDDDNRSSRSGSRTSSSRSQGSSSGEGHGGWFGDSRAHSEAAKRGWQNR